VLTVVLLALLLERFW